MATQENTSINLDQISNDLNHLAALAAGVSDICKSDIHLTDGNALYLAGHTAAEINRELGNIAGQIALLTESRAA